MADPFLPDAEPAARVASTLINLEPNHAPETLYFAYGSNLHLEQMAGRCPSSRYIGRAVLESYRWQINQRGYANIVESPGDKVEGLVYLLNEMDAFALDVDEGVPECYEKIRLEVKLFSGGIHVLGRKVAELVDNEVLGKAEVEQRSIERRRRSALAMGVPLSSVSSHSKYETVEVLVYIDFRRSRDGKPRSEYIERMKNGIKDAEILGVSKPYLDQTVSARLVN